MQHSSTPDYVLRDGWSNSKTVSLSQRSSTNTMLMVKSFAPFFAFILLSQVRGGLLLPSKVTSGWNQVQSGLNQVKTFLSFGKKTPNGIRTGNDSGNDVYDEKLKATEISLPKGFFTGDVPVNSHCMKAYLQMAEFCTSISETDRLRLATAIAGCHLEAANLMPVSWHVKTKLKKASENQVSLVQQYLPLLGRICRSTSHFSDFNMFRIQFQMDVRLLKQIGNLKLVIEDTYRATSENRKVVSKLKEFSSNTDVWIERTEKTSKHLQATADALELEYRELASIERSMRRSSEIQGQDYEVFRMQMAEFLEKAQVHIELLTDHATLQDQHNELSASYMNLQEEIIGVNQKAGICAQDQRNRMNVQEEIIRVNRKADTCEQDLQNRMKLEEKIIRANRKANACEQNLKNQMKLQEKIVHGSCKPGICEQDFKNRLFAFFSFVNLSSIVSEDTVASSVEVAQGFLSNLSYWIVFPFAAIKQIQRVKTSHWIDQRFEMVFSLIQAPMYLFAVALIFKLSMVIAKLSILYRPITWFIGYSLLQLRKVLVLLLYPAVVLSAYVSPKSRDACNICAPHGLERDIPNLLEQRIATIQHTLSVDVPKAIEGNSTLASSVGKAVKELRTARKRTNSMGASDKTLGPQLLGKMYRMETRQILIWEELRKVRTA